MLVQMLQIMFIKRWLHLGLWNILQIKMVTIIMIKQATLYNHLFNLVDVVIGPKIRTRLSTNASTTIISRKSWSFLIITISCKYWFLQLSDYIYMDTLLENFCSIAKIRNTISKMQKNCGTLDITLAQCIKD